MMTSDIERLKKQLKKAGYNVNRNTNIEFHKYFGKWGVTINLKGTTRADRQAYWEVEVILWRRTSRYFRTFVTGHKDILGPIEQWITNQIAFEEFLKA